MFKLVLAVAAIISAQAWAGQDGNGGDGIVIDNNVYTYDLVEHGLHKKHYFGDPLQVGEDIRSVLRAKLYALSSDVRELVGRKLEEVKAVDKVFFKSLLLTLGQYNWSVIEDFSLIEVDDEDGSDVNIPKERFRQVAVRSMRSIKLDQRLLAKMDSENIAAMVIHEVVYAMTPLENRTVTITEPQLDIEPPGDGINIIVPPPKTSKHNYYHQSSRRAREVVAYLFSPQLVYGGQAGLYALLKSDQNEGYPVGKTEHTSLQGNAFIDELELRFKYHYSELRREYLFNPGMETDYRTLQSNLCDENNGDKQFSITAFIHKMVPKHLSYKSFDPVTQQFSSKMHLKIIDNLSTDYMERHFFSHYPKETAVLYRLKKKESKNSCNYEMDQAWNLLVGK
jgi:hypothetical protein